MKKIELNKKTIFLSLIILWCAISIVFYWIPYLSEISDFANNIKYEIISGYISEQYLNKNIYSLIYLSIINIMCILFLFVVCILSYKKERLIRYIGVGIIWQTLIIILLKVWNNNLVDDYRNTEVISLKYWLMISITICVIISILYIFNKKLTYIILCIATFLQIFYTIELFKLNLGFFTQESIINTNYLSIIFQCIDGVVIYILFWTLLIDSVKSKSEE